MTTTETTSPDRRSAPGVLVDPAAYRRIVYLLTSFPLGVGYLVLLTVTLSLGAGLAVLGVGIPLVLAGLLAAHRLAAVERWRARVLLGVDVDPPRRPDAGGGLLERTRQLVGAEATWRAVGGLLVIFALGTVALAVILPLVVLALALVTAPLTYDLAGFEIQLVVFQPARLVDALALVPPGVAVFVVALSVADRVARVGGGVVVSLLGR